MLIRKMYESSDRVVYGAGYDKYLDIYKGEDGRVTKIDMCNGSDIFASFDATAIVFPGCFTVKNDQYLSTELLTIWEDAFEEAYTK